jgi:hypothetical protein
LTRHLSRWTSKRSWSACGRFDPKSATTIPRNVTAKCLESKCLLVGTCTCCVDGSTEHIRPTVHRIHARLPRDPAGHNREGPSRLHPLTGKRKFDGGRTFPIIRGRFPGGIRREISGIILLTGSPFLPPTSNGQPDSWQLVTPPSGIVSAVILLLQKTPDTSTDPTVTIGDSGCAIPHLVTKTLASSVYKETHTIWNAANCSWPLLDPPWQGKLHGGRPPSGMSMEMTLREVAKFLDSKCLGDPRRSTPGQLFLDTQFADIL